MTEAATPVSYKGWAGIKRAFGTPSALTMALLGFGSGLPFLLIASQTLSTRLRDVGLDLGSIGLISLASFFYLLKFLWAPLLDRYAFPLLGGLGRRRSWLLVSQALVLVGLVALAFVRPEQGVWPLVAWVLVASFAGATQDSAVDAYRIEIAPQAAQAALAATYTLGYRIGLILAGAGALYLAQFEGWIVAYLAMAALMILPIITTLFCREPERPANAVQRRIDIAEAFVQPITSFFSRNGVALALVLLAFVGLFKFPDQVIGVMAGPFYLDSGFDKADIATVSKLFGVWMGIGGGPPGRHRGGRVRFPPHAAGGRAGRGAVQPGLPADGAQSGAVVGVLRCAQCRQPVPGLRRHGAGGVHVFADRSQLHCHPVRAAGLAGQPARQVRRRRLRLHRGGHLVQHLLHAQRCHGGADHAAAGLVVAADRGSRPSPGA